jgi:glycosyltransferase involved in cell wall biosynthesis
MEDVTIGIKTFLRPDKLRENLSAIEDRSWEPAEVIIADDGKQNSSKDALYEEFRNKLPVKVLDLEFDLGLASSRNRMVEECSTEYLLMLDDDMIPPENTPVLRETLSKTKYGGISGIMNEYGALRAAAADVYVESDLMVLDIRDSKIPDKSGVVKFDYIPNCALFRTECLEEFPWDDHYIITGEHEDFYLNHHLNSGWSFGVLEDVVFDHRPESDVTYLEHRDSSEKRQNSYRYLKEKWDIDGIVRIEQYILKDSGDTQRKLKTKIKKLLPARLVWEIQRTQVLKKLRNLT